MAYFKVVMYSCKIFGSYPRHHEHAKDFFCSSLMFKKVYLPVFKFSNRLVTSGLSNEQSKTGVVIISTAS